ncbi:hypothetical protein JCM10450v2_003921 [Rhodotorula kratochvilovae]
MLAPVLAFAALAGTAVAQSSSVPLAAKRFQWDNLPYQADTDNGERGRQVGYNRCNETTQGQESLCQTAVINRYRARSTAVSIDDFCLWAPPTPGEEVGNIEGEMVAWCTKEGYGTRIIPEGALQGVQFIQTPHYVQVVGYIDQVKINMLPDDYGGEMDPHGADQRGNPLGGLLFSNAFGANTTTNGTSGGQQFQQVIQWHNFMGGAQFCLKACNPSWENGWAMCEHIFDRIGCIYNAPSNWAKINGTFESCQGDDQLYPGQYVEGGRTLTYTQPPESLGVITTVPYVPFTPSSSECTPYTSSAIYTAAAQVAPSSSSASASASTTDSASSSASETGSTSRTGSGASSAPAATGSNSSQAAQGGNSGADGLKVAALMTAGVAGLLGALVAL